MSRPAPLRTRLSRLRSRTLSPIRQLYYRYPYPTIFINHLPKSASTWFANLLATSIPGYAYDNPESLRDTFNFSPSFLHDTRDRLLVLRNVMPPTGDNEAFLRRHLPRTVALVRDPRDILVSYYHMTLNPRYQETVLTLDPLDDRPPPPWHTLPRSAANNPKTLYDKLIETWLPSFIDFAGELVSFARAYPEDTLLLRYEDITTNPCASLRKAHAFFNCRVPERCTEGALSAHTKERLRPGQLKFRKGEMGEWRTELSAQQQDRATALVTDFLREMNYKP